MAKYLFTSESVTEGHPDKICDRISDGVLDAILAQDKNARVACETCATTGMVLIMGEITTTANVDIPAIARDVIKETGYDNSDYGFDYKTCAILTTLDKQSPDIAMGVDNALEGRDKNEFDTGAGDQGMMFGYATNETENYMPLALDLSHSLLWELAEIRKNENDLMPYLRPDAKSQGTIEYDDNGKPLRIDTIVVSTQHLPDVDMNVLKKDIIEKVIKPIVPANLLDENTKYFINPTGRFVIGGPHGDSGLTGRKIIVDTYGGAARHGGGAFSGKDPTKVDRSASYMARHIAKNIVANGYAKKCEIQIAYSIGVAKPVSIYVNTYGTNTIPEEKIIEKIDKTFDLTPRAIINYLDLQRPIYRQTTNYGHFGKKDLPWEKIINF